MDEEHQLEKASKQVVAASLLARRGKLKPPIPKVDVEFLINLTGRINSDSTAYSLDSKFIQIVRKQLKKRPHETRKATQMRTVNFMPINK